MAQKTKPAADKRAVEKIDFDQPFYLTVRQAPSRNIIEPFQSLDAATKSAAAAAASSKTDVAIFGPQIAVLSPPPPPVAVSKTLPWMVTEEETPAG